MVDKILTFRYEMRHVAKTRLAIKMHKEFTWIVRKKDFLTRIQLFKQLILMHTLQNHENLFVLFVVFDNNKYHTAPTTKWTIYTILKVETNVSRRKKAQQKENT